MLFSWYFKGFELLRCYLVKHPSGVDLQSLALEVVDQEMAADEATQSSAPEEIFFFFFLDLILEQFNLI